MIGPHSVLLDIALLISTILLCVAALLALIRLARGPTIPDRVVALDLFSMIFVGAIVVGSIYYKQEVFINAAVILAMVVFIGTIAFARFLERRVSQ